MRHIEYKGKIYGFIDWRWDLDHAVMVLRDLYTGETHNLALTSAIGGETGVRFTDNVEYRDEQINKIIDESNLCG
jgi:hypothetical protein